MKVALALMLLLAGPGNGVRVELTTPLVSAPYVAMTVAVLAARSRIACGRFPDFLAMRRFKLSSGAADGPRSGSI